MFMFCFVFIYIYIVNKTKSEPFSFPKLYFIHNLINYRGGKMAKKRCVSPVQWPFTVPIVQPSTVCSTGSYYSPGTATLAVQCLSSSFRTDSTFRVQPLFRIQPLFNPGIFHSVLQGSSGRRFMFCMRGG